MNERKQHVIKISHQLFIEKGFHSTSIQDILEASGISKGTFYNYFSSKNELFKEVFSTLYFHLEEEREAILIGKDRTSIEIFMEQMEFQLKKNRANRVLPLFEEAFFSKEEELKQFIAGIQLRTISWVYNRFIDIFGEEKKPYLLDGAITFMGILHQNLRYEALAHGNKDQLLPVIQFSVDRIVHMIGETSRSKSQLFEPELLNNWLPKDTNREEELRRRLREVMTQLKANIVEDQFYELLDFIEDELVDSKKPRKFLIETTYQTLEKHLPSVTLTELRKVISDFIE